MSSALHVLILDDSEDDALLLVRELRRSGYQPAYERTSSAEGMRAALARGGWDIILCDYAMPAFNALDALALLHQSGQDLPLIIVSGTLKEDMAVDAFKAGAHDFVIKGNLARLAPAIERELREAQNRRLRRQAEERLTVTLDSLLEGAQIIGFDWRYRYANQAAAAQWHTTPPALLGHTLEEVFPGIERTELFAALRECMEQRAARHTETEFTYPDGTTGWFDLFIQPVPEGSFILSQDITERKRAEADLAHDRNVLRTVIDNVPDFIYAKDSASRFTLINRASANSLGREPEEVIGKTDFELHPPELAAQFLSDEQRVMQTGQPLIDREEMMYENGQERWQLTTTVPLRDGAGQVTGIVGISRNITGRRQTEVELKQRLGELSALRAIDQAITASMDLQLTLTVLLSHVVTQLAVDAAAIWLLEPADHMLHYAAGSGFRTNDFQNARVRIGDGRVGRVALERRMIAGSSQEPAQRASRRTALLSREDFVSYYGVPLIAKGRVLGVLEIYHRAPLAPDEGWLSFLEALAGQAAIAIDNAALFEGLQRSNLELTLAYDATITGWSRALDLRDRETEGHSQRVTELTGQLAARLGIDKGKLVHVRRGALLHDIGKMGVPDSILLKPGPLSDDEWVAMRQHPVFAYQMLEPIRYLHPALEIPYCHHEKWDGTGYPRRLKGEAIPLAARVFAVADVWDALCSDRPYRPAWPEAQVREHIRAQAGLHFDPAVVKAFLELNFAGLR
jgi:PAS domain S-box-containing protein